LNKLLAPIAAIADSSASEGGTPWPLDPENALPTVGGSTKEALVEPEHCAKALDCPHLADCRCITDDLHHSATGEGLGLVFGANVGTTGTGWLVALIGDEMQRAYRIATLGAVAIAALTATVDPEHPRRRDRHGEAEEDRYHDDQGEPFAPCRFPAEPVPSILD
jgi:hypothetical protein